ncbi:protein Hook homolog 2-like [Neoarius graeffei]|uniref:protein Hook homolog 2-like n=1 Tax=Neoarius graeffei TaxID=443677 RepID=UPI00298D495B|nr:protein Hook homolog 2-like [Neoarius graeffei]
MAQFQPPTSLCLQGNLAENWGNWSQRFELFCTASGIAEKSEKVQCATFLHVAGEETIKVLGQQVVDEHVPDVSLIGEMGDATELGRLVQLVLGCTVSCEKKQSTLGDQTAVHLAVQSNHEEQTFTEMYFL